MPNYCENKITLSGDPKAVKKAFSFMASGESPLDFNKIIPYPKEFEEKDKEFETLGWDGYKAKYGNLDAGFGAGGYEWCVQNWGTKWNACVPYRSGNTIEFQTAWSPAEPIISAIHAKNPQVGITYTYNEPGMSYAGMQVFEPVGEGTEPAGKPTQDHYWGGKDYDALYPDYSLTSAFEEALFNPPNPLGHLTRDQLTKREEETAVAAIKELTTILVDGCFHGDTGPIDEEAARFELTKLGNTLKVLIDSKFAPEIQEVIDTVVPAARAALIEKETTMAKSNPKKKGVTEVAVTEFIADMDEATKPLKEDKSKKTTAAKRPFLTLEEAKKKILAMAMEHRDSNSDMAGFRFLSVMYELPEEDHDDFMDYLSSSEFEEQVEELNPKVGEKDHEFIRQQIVNYNSIAPYNRNAAGNYVNAITGSTALGTGIGADHYNATVEEALKYVLARRVPNNNQLLNGQGTFIFEKGDRSKLGTKNYSTEKLSKYDSWRKFQIMLRSPHQIPAGLQADMQSSLLRTLLGLDKNPRMGSSSYVETTFSVRNVVTNESTVISYQEVCDVWTAFLRSYKFVLGHLARIEATGMVADGIGDFVSTGIISTQLLTTMKQVEQTCWEIYMTDRIFEALKGYIGDK